MGNGDGSFRSAAAIPVGPTPVALAAGDFNGDGSQDLAVVNTGMLSDYRGTVSVLLGNGDGSFQASPVSYATGIDPVFLVAADLNGNGLPDLAAANENSGDVGILLNDGVWPSPAGRTVPRPPRPWRQPSVAAIIRAEEEASRRDAPPAPFARPATPAAPPAQPPAARAVGAPRDDRQRPDVSAVLPARDDGDPLAGDALALNLEAVNQHAAPI